jgi:hypothetical protein
MELNDPAKQLLCLTMKFESGSTKVLILDLMSVEGKLHCSHYLTSADRAYALGVTEDPHWTKALSCNTLSEESITFLKEQLGYCLEQHPQCQPGLDTRPTRLLRIESSRDPSDAYDGLVYLDDDKEAVTYATFSHCWGRVQPVRLTQATVADLRAGLPIKSLPKSFREAVFVCQHTGVQYLWIDSLCIFQDDLQDWAFEAASMCPVYANALFNIAATGASDSSIGLSFERNSLALQPFCITSELFKQCQWVFPPDWAEDVIMSSPLNQRAWVAQERFLSSRIMHFTIVGPYWECMKCNASEVYRDSTPSLTTSHHFLDSFLKLHLGTLSKDLTSKLTSSSLDDLYLSWLYTLSSYSHCKITRESDKLVALSGIAQKLEQRIEIGLVCGMWDCFLSRELLWEVKNGSERDEPPRLCDWRAPSWSWASGDFRLTTESYWYTHLDCNALQETLEVIKLDVNSLPSGQLKHASLLIRAKLLEARLLMEDYDYSGRSSAVLDCKHGKSHVDDESFVFDRLPEFPYEEELTFIAAMKCRCTRGHPWDSTNELVSLPSIAALMLRRLPTTPTTYSRVGVLRLRGVDACELYNSNEPADEEEIVIV